MIRTSQTHPIRVDAVPVRNGLLGLTFCPGKHGDSLNGAPWARDLDTDLHALRDWGASLILTLIEPHEFGLLRVPDLGARVAAQGMSWAHLPIRDVDVPAAPFRSGWPGPARSRRRRRSGTCGPTARPRPRRGPDPERTL